MIRIEPYAAALLLILASAPAPADFASKQWLGNALREAADTVDEVITLNAGGSGFIALHRAHQRGEGRGAVMLLPDPAHNADSHAVIRPLRLGLAEAGWDTLSLQLPAPYPGEAHDAWLARNPSIGARISAGLDWLKQQGQLNQVLLAEGGSSAALLQFAKQQTPPELQALVLISPPLERGSAGLSALPEVELPLLDVYAERDLATVRDGADLRRQVAQGNPATQYRQRRVPGAIADFPGLQDALLATVRSWLAATAEGRQVSIKP